MERRIKRKTKWRDEFIVRATHLARDGMTEAQMAKMLGISKITFTIWEREKPLFKLAVEEGRNYTKRGRKDEWDISDYILPRLSPKSRILWKKIHAFGRSGKDQSRVTTILGRKAKRMRQDMFLCAWITGNFSIAKACRKIGINRNTFELWKKEKHFQRMILEIEESKNDFIESCYLRQIAAGDSNVIIHGADTRLKDRGYSRKATVDVNVTGQIEHTHHMALMENLDLPVSIQKMILDKMREQRKLVNSTIVNDQNGEA